MLLLLMVFTIITISISASALTSSTNISSSNQTLLDLSNVASIDNTHLVAEKFQTSTGFAVANSNVTANVVNVLHDVTNTGSATVNTFVLTSELKWPEPTVELQSLQSNSILIGTTAILDATGINYTDGKNSVTFASDHILVSDDVNSLDVQIGNIEISNKFLNLLVFIGTDMNISTTGTGGAFLFLPTPGGFQSGSLNFSNLYNGFTLRITASGTFVTNNIDISDFTFCTANTTLSVDKQPQQIILGDSLDGLGIFAETNHFPWYFNGILTINAIENDTITMQSFGNFWMISGDGSLIGPEQTYQKTSQLFNGLELSFWGIISQSSGITIPIPSMTLQKLSIEQLR
jgi:hypothetical protein